LRPNPPFRHFGPKAAVVAHPGFSDDRPAPPYVAVLTSMMFRSGSITYNCRNPDIPERLTSKRIWLFSSASSLYPASARQDTLEIIRAKSEVDIIVVHSLSAEVPWKVFGKVYLKARSAAKPDTFDFEGRSIKPLKCKNRLVECRRPVRVGGDKRYVMQNDGHCASPVL
jgi:hypothetical protein